MTLPTGRRRGRPATGVHAGERMSDYQRMTIRLPADAHARLLSASTVTGIPAWRLILSGVDLVIANLPDADRALIGKLARRQMQREPEA